MPRRPLFSAAERESLLALPDTEDLLIRHFQDRNGTNMIPGGKFKATPNSDQEVSRCNVV